MQKPVTSLNFLFLRLFFTVIPFFSSAQLSKHGNIWHFGAGGGLDFTNGMPAQLTGIVMDSYEGCAVWCDKDGKLQIYTNGGGSINNTTNGPRNGYIWNKNQSVLYDMGDSKGGGYSAAQSALILPKPGSANILYVFTMDHAPNNGVRGLSYFSVDMTLNGGLGGIVEEDVRIFTQAEERLTAIPHSNGTDYWVLTLDRDTRDFVVVPVTSAGIGTPLLKPRVSSSSEGIVFKASPDGNFFSSDNEIYTFDKSTGNLTYKTEVATNKYTFSFSPSSRYLYAMDPSLFQNIVRYDLQAADISKSLDTIVSPIQLPFPGLMQLAPDGNIYFMEQLEEDFLTLPPTMSLSVIRCPDGLIPSLERSFLKFETDIENAGGLFTSLPNFADYIFARPPATDTIRQNYCEKGMPMSLKPIKTGQKYKWSTGETTAEISVKKGGTYSVQIDDACSWGKTVFELDTTDCCNPIYPNAFTPNADATNDTFAPEIDYCGAEYAELDIYSRWGELMFQGIELNDRWDGTTLNGTPATTDVYVYVYRYKLKTEPSEQMRKGEVNLIR